MRTLIGVVDDWYALFRNAYRVAKPGSYVESYVPGSDILSDNGSVKEDSPYDQWCKVFREGGKKLGRTFAVYQEDLQRKCMEAAGFVDIQFKDIQVPAGVWHPEKGPAEIGLWWKISVEADLEGKIGRNTPLMTFDPVNPDNTLKDTSTTYGMLSLVGLRMRRKFLPVT